MYNILDNIVDFEVAKLLKQSNFNVPVKSAYSFDGRKADVPNGEFSNRGEKYVSAPTYSEVLSWFYKELGLWVWVACKEDDIENKVKFIPCGRILKGGEIQKKNGFEVDPILYNPKECPLEAYKFLIKYSIQKFLIKG
jgi:hypothetical protein